MASHSLSAPGGWVPPPPPPAPPTATAVSAQRGLTRVDAAAEASMAGYAGALNTEPASLELTGAGYDMDLDGVRATDDDLTWVVRVDPASELANEIAEEFATEGLEVTAAFQVNNTPASEVYEARKYATRTGRSAPEHYLWHGTPDGSDARLDSIVGEGLHPSTKAGYLGANCVYLGEVGKASMYAIPRDAVKLPHSLHPLEERTMVRARVLLGRTLYLAPGKYDPTLTRAPRGYDSVSASIFGGREYGVYDSTRVLVDLVVRFRCVCPTCSARRLDAIVATL